ncbi:unnamed protein product [Lota lota]
MHITLRLHHANTHTSKLMGAKTCLSVCLSRSISHGFPGCLSPFPLLPLPGLLADHSLTMASPPLRGETWRGSTCALFTLDIALVPWVWVWQQQRFEANSEH